MTIKRISSKTLAFLLAAALILSFLPGTAKAAGYTYTQNGSRGATLTFISAVTAAEVDHAELATVSYSGASVTVTALSGAVGVATVTVTAGGERHVVAVPVGYTTFIFSGDAVTVYEGRDTNYKVTGYDSAEQEHTPAQSSGADGGVTYTAESDAYSLCVEIKKSGGVYAFSGTGNDMSVAVKKDATADTTLLLAGVSLTSSLTAPIAVKKKADEAAIAAGAKVYITALEGHVNTLADAAYNNADNYADNVLAESAVIKGKAYANVVLDGHGTLNLVCSSKNAIKVAEYGTLTVRSLTLNVNSAGHGISCDNAATFRSGTVSVTAAGDGIRSDPDAVDASAGAAGTIVFYDADVTVSASGDGIQAAQDLTIYGGSFQITTFGGYQNKSSLGDESAKGLKASAGSSDDSTDTSEATNYLHILGGSFTLNCADDAIHSDAYAVIEGGTFDIWTGDDGAHADTSLTLGTEGGANCAVQMSVNYCYEGLEAGNVYVYSGSYYVCSTDDGMNAADGSGGDGTGFNPGGGPGGPGGPGGGGETAGDFSINICGGLLKVVASGDGLDSNGDLNLTGGTVVVWAGSGPENPLDCDGSLTVKGATVFAAGYNNMAAKTPASGSQSYKTATTSLTKGRTVTVTVNGSTAVSQTVAQNAAYEFYSQPDSFTSMTVSQSTAAAADTPATWLAHTVSGGVCPVCGLHVDGASGIADSEATDSDSRVDAASGTQDTGFAVRFVTDGSYSVRVYASQDVSGEPYAVVTAAGVSFADGYDAIVSRSASTGAPDSSGDGQVNFVIVPADGYQVSEITIDGGYKNLKDVSEASGTANCWRITKVTGELTVSITTESAAAAGTMTAKNGSLSLTWRFDPEAFTLTASGSLSDEAMLLAAAYDDSGKLLSCGRITQSGGTVEIDKSASLVKLFWVDGAYAPLCACAKFATA